MGSCGRTQNGEGPEETQNLVKTQDRFPELIPLDFPSQKCLEQRNMIEIGGRCLGPNLVILGAYSCLCLQECPLVVLGCGDHMW